jgi:CRISPR-associated protein Csd1
MLISRLVDYQRSINPDADPFFEKKPVRWAVEYGDDGRFIQLHKLGDEKRGLDKLVPKKVGAVSGGVAAFGTDNPRFVLGYMTTPDEKKAGRDHAAFVDLARKAAESHAEARFTAAVAFLDRPDQVDAARQQAVAEKVADGDRMALSWHGDRGTLLFETDAGMQFWREYRQEQEASKKQAEAVRCLACGQVAPPVLTNDTKIMGVPDAQPSGAALVSFDKESFQSYGWDKNVNAPVCEQCSRDYTRGLNDLLDRSNRSRIDQEGVAFVYWQDSGRNREVVNIFEEPDSDDSRRILSAAQTGRLPDLGIKPSESLYALALRGNGGRAVVTEWFEETLGVAYSRLARWFEDLQLVLAFPEREGGQTVREQGALSRPPRLWMLVQATVRKGDKASPRLPSAIVRSALTGEPLPLWVADACARRLDLEENGFGDFLAPARLGLIRATINRRIRALNLKEKELQPGLDTTNEDPAYLCGRLLATLEAAQYAGVGDVGANIVDRYYGKASSAPSLVFGQLMKLAQSHLSAISNEGQRVNLDKEVQEIVGQLGASFPKTLSVEQQGAFAIGYYHQKAHRFAEIQRRRAERASQQEDTTEETNQS